MALTKKITWMEIKANLSLEIKKKKNNGSDKNVQRYFLIEVQVKLNQRFQFSSVAQLCLTL